MPDDQFIATHVGVYGVVIKHNQLLLVKKSSGPYKGLLDLPGGRMETGESPSDALQRELREETGIRPLGWRPLKPLTFKGTYLENGESKAINHLGLIYEVAEYDDSQLDLQISDQDVDGAKWVPLNQKGELSPFAEEIRQLFADQPKET
jgi:8-oxo-dGTP diphosphatase